MKKIVQRLGLATGLLAFGVLGASAADLTSEGGYAVAYCAGSASSSLVDTASDAELTENVVRLMDEAVAVSNDQQWIYSSRPVFVWANEAKVACGKAYGYLKFSVRDEQTLNNCGCFHDRMVSFMH
jgi:hypothetical protein